jgi:hypothetical protein
LENALNLRKVGIWVENTTDPGFGQLQSTFSFGFVVEGMEQMVLLAYKENNDARREIVLLTTPQQDTTIKEERLVVWQLEEIAKEFCKSRRLIADLIKCGDQAQVIFSNIQSLVAEYDCFHSEDYEEEGHIVIRVTVSSDQDTAFKEYETYNKWMMENITDEGLEHFVVVVRRIG